MATEKRVTFTDAGEPVVTITITGWHDAFRFAWAMGHLQCEFADVARRIGGSLRRRLGAKDFGEMHRHFTGNETHRWVRDDEELAEGERGTLDVSRSTPSEPSREGDGEASLRPEPRL